MVSRFRERFTFANAASSIALFAALSTGGAYAADKIGSKEIDRNAVKSKHLKNKGVKTNDLAKRAVKTTNLARQAVKGNKVAEGTLLSEHFADGQLPQGKQGPQGPQGPRGVSGYQVVEVSGGTFSTFPSGATRVVDTSCGDKEVLGGGIDLTAAEDGGVQYTDRVTVIRSFPTSEAGGNGWRMIVRNDHNDGLGVTFNHYAICVAAS